MVAKEIMGFIKNLFKKPKDERKLTNVADLNTGDIIVLDDSFALPELLRGQQFEVTAVNSYEFEHHTETEWVLSGTNASELFLSLYKDDKTYLKLALKLEEDDVETLFELDQFWRYF